MAYDIGFVISICRMPFRKAGPRKEPSDGNLAHPQLPHQTLLRSPVVTSQTYPVHGFVSCSPSAGCWPRWPAAAYAEGMCPCGGTAEAAPHPDGGARAVCTTRAERRLQDGEPCSRHGAWRRGRGRALRGDGHEPQPARGPMAARNRIALLRVGAPGWRRR
jgi:hypothetical protein